jgi:adenosylhomocysteinase
MTIQTAVLIETLQALGASSALASCNIFSTQDHAAAAIAAAGTPVFAWKGETEANTGTMPSASLEGPTADLQHDPRDGGEHDPRRRRRPDPRKSRVHARSANRPQGPDERRYRGLSEETTTGVHRLYDMERSGRAALPGDQRQRQRDQVQVRQPLRLQARSLVDGIRRATDVMLAGKVAVVAATATSARARRRACATAAPASS